jgi:hypothetical protein
MRNLVQKRFPKIDNDGFIYTAKPGLVGNQSIASRKFMHTDEKVEGFLMNAFPQRPRYCVTTAETRAHYAKGQGMWSEETIQKAANCFMIPDETEFLIIWPDLMDRYYLRKDSIFLKPINKKETPKHQGVMTICPYCGSNNSVKFKSWNVVEHNSSPRMVVKGDGSKQPILSPVYTCSSLECNHPNGKYNETKQFRTTRKFNLYSKETFAKYPESIRRKYAECMSQGLGFHRMELHLHHQVFV